MSATLKTPGRFRPCLSQTGPKPTWSFETRPKTTAGWGLGRAESGASARRGRGPTAGARAGTGALSKILESRRRSGAHAAAGLDPAVSDPFSLINIIKGKFGVGGSPIFCRKPWPREPPDPRKRRTDPAWIPCGSRADPEALHAGPMRPGATSRHVWRPGPLRTTPSGDGRPPTQRRRATAETLNRRPFFSSFFPYVHAQPSAKIISTTGRPPSESGPERDVGNPNTSCPP